MNVDRDKIASRPEHLPGVGVVIAGSGGCGVI